MTFDEFKKLITPLAVQLGAEYDLPTWRLFHRSVQEIPIPLFAAAIEEAGKTRSKMPSAAQLRDLAEASRQALIAAHPYDGCIDCEDSKGWLTVTVDGVQRMQRCPCRHRYQARLEGLGVTCQPLSLPAGRESDLEKIV